MTYVCSVFKNYSHRLRNFCLLKYVFFISFKPVWLQWDQYRHEKEEFGELETTLVPLLVICWWRFFVPEKSFPLIPSSDFFGKLLSLIYSTYVWGDHPCIPPPHAKNDQIMQHTLTLPHEFIKGVAWWSLIYWGDFLVLWTVTSQIYIISKLLRNRNAK